MIRTIIILGAVAMLGACHVPPPVYVIQGPPEKVTTNGPPPEARLEIPSVAPQEGYVWTPGYWHYGPAGAGYQWVEGRWVPERRDYYWHEATYVYVNSIWIYRPPFWRPRVWHDPDLQLFQRGRYHHGHGQHHRHGRGQHAGAQGGGKQAMQPPGGGSTGGPPSVTSTPASSTSGRAAAPSAGGGSNQGRVAAPPATPDVKTPPPTLTSDHEADSPGAQHAMTRDPHQEANLRRRPEYRGQVEGRPIFGDAAHGKSPGYVTDSTGAIILTNEPGRVQRSRSQQEALRRQDEAAAARARAQHRPERGPEVDPRVHGEPQRHRGLSGTMHRGEHRRADPARMKGPPPAQRRPDQVRVHRPEPRIQQRPQPRIQHRPQPRVHRPEPRIQSRPPQPRIQQRPEPRVQHRPQPRVQHRHDPRRNQAAPSPPQKRRERAAPAPAPRPEGRGGRRRK